MKIIHLTHSQINKKQWDALLQNYEYHLPYAYSWYLDIVCPQWEALVSDDYSYLMPLPCKKKLHIKYLVHPLWVQQLGIISANKRVEQSILKQFITHIPYRIFDFNLNYCNIIEYNDKSLHLLEMRTNLILHPNKAHYNSNATRNIRNAKTYNYVIKPIDNKAFIDFWKANAKYTSDVKNEQLYKLLNSPEKTCEMILLGEYVENELIAAIFAIQTDNRLIYLAPVSNVVGYSVKAMFLLVDYLINYCKEHQLILDFEGSQIDGLKQFYKGFGAEEENYPRIAKNYPVNLLTKLHKLFK